MKPSIKTFVWARPVLALGAWSGVLAASAVFSSCAQAAPPSAEALAQIQAAAPTKPAVRPQKARRVLVYTGFQGFQHSSRETGAEAMKILGQKTGAWSAVLSDSPASFEDLSGYDAIVFLNTTGEALLPAGFNALSDADKAAARQNEARYKANLLAFVNGGKGFVGIHSATDTYWQGPNPWTEFTKMIGGSFVSHPWNAGDEVTTRVEDPSSPVMRSLGGQAMTFKEEIYMFREADQRKNQRVLLGLDMTKTRRPESADRDDDDYAVSWIKTQGAGRVFYCSLGHNEDMYARPQVLEVYLAGIQYALGDLKADATPIAQLPPDYADAALGEYAGAIGTSRNAAQTLVRVFPQGSGNYRATVYWPDAAKPAANNLLRALGGRRIEMTGTLNAAANTIDFAGRDGEADVKATWTGPSGLVSKTPATMRLTQLSPSMAAQAGLNANAAVVASPVVRTSPTLGAVAPIGAIALIPYARDAKGRESGPSLSEWKNENWIPMRDGSVQVRGGDNVTKREFGDVKVHVEWLSPLMPEARGQGRGNSGVYLQERYEVQVLDSFGLELQDNEAGGLYKIAKPAFNASLPPGRWQTYDITYRAPRLFTDGSVQKPAVITVIHNGVAIHNNQEIPSTTGGGAQGFVAKAPLRLQDHGDRVRYRNVWVQELADQPYTPVANPNAAQRALFDGKNLDAFAWGEGKTAPAIEDGAMRIQDTGDVWSKDQFENFVMDMEWKVDPGANSGVFIRNPRPGDWFAGMEIQVADSFGANPPGIHDAGANYDVQAPSKNALKPTGQWNAMRVTARGQNIVVEMNGEKVLDQDLSRWTEAGKNPDGSNNKFKTAYKDMPRRGHIELQDHGGAPVWYRNIRVREIK